MPECVSELLKWPTWQVTDFRDTLKTVRSSVHKMDHDRETAKAKRRFLARIQHAPDRGTGGVIRWSREELHRKLRGYARVTAATS